MMEPVTFVVDDDEAARNSLTFLLRVEKIRARSFPSATDFLEQLLPEHCGCIVTDVRMPGMDGITLVNEVRKRGCPMPVIVITGHADVALAVEAMKAGAYDFIEKPFESAVMLRNIRNCMEESLARGAKKTQNALIRHRIEKLTEREHEVFTWLVQGKSNKEIALILNISPRTVEVHRANIMVKLDAENLVDLLHMNMLAADPD